MPLTEAQLRLRQTGITGSQIATLAGLCPWSSPIGVWREKVVSFDQLPDRPDLTTDMERGIFFEEPCIRWYVKRTGRPVAQTGTLVHPENPLIIATPDGVSLGTDSTERPQIGGRTQWHHEDVILEVKCPSWRTARFWGEQGTDKIPRYYYPQVIWEMAVTGLRHAHVVAYFGDDLRIYNVAWNQDIFDALSALAENFWRDYVQTREPPPVDGSSDYAEFIAAQFPEPSEDMGTVASSDADAWRAIEVMQSAERIMKAQKERLEEAKNVLKSRIGINRGLSGDFGRITWSKNSDSARVNWEAVAKSLGATEETIKQYTTIRPGPRTFRATWRES